MTISIKPWQLALLVIATIAALYFFVGKETCAIYCMFMTFSGCLWIYRFRKAYQEASEHLEKHDMSVDISYMGN
jgi:hypothetical protein